MLLALFGIVMGQAVVWYASQFYTMFFLTQTLKVDGGTSNLLIIVATVVTTPFYVLFGMLSDRIGPQTGIPRPVACLPRCLLPAVQGTDSLWPIPVWNSAQQQGADHGVGGSCRMQLPVSTRWAPRHSPVRAISREARLQRAALNYVSQSLPAGSTAQLKIGNTTIASFKGSDAGAAAKITQLNDAIDQALKASGYSIGTADPCPDQQADDHPCTDCPDVVWHNDIRPDRGDARRTVSLPGSAYTAMSLPYHIGIGWFGGFLPAAVVRDFSRYRNIYSGLWYPVILASICFVICLFFVRESKNVNIYSASADQHAEA